MAIPYSTRTAFIFTGANSGGTPVFLGTAEQKPNIEIRPGWEPLFNDVSGTRIPIDISYQGEDALISVDLTRWNEGIHSLLAHRQDAILAAGAGAVRGTDLALERGTLMLTESKAYPLWVWYPGAALAPYAANLLPAGYRFPHAWLEGPDRLEPGTSPYRVRLVFRALGSFNAATLSFFCYDHNMTGISAAIIN